MTAETMVAWEHPLPAKTVDRVYSADDSARLGLHTGASVDSPAVLGLPSFVPDANQLWSALLGSVFEGEARTFHFSGGVQFLHSGYPDESVDQGMQTGGSVDTPGALGLPSFLPNASQLRPALLGNLFAGEAQTFRFPGGAQFFRPKQSPAFDVAANQRRMEMTEEVERLLDIAHQPDWDGEGGLPVAEGTVEKASQFLSCCPRSAFDEGLDFSADCSSRGDVMLTWAISHRYLFTVLVTSHDQLVHSLYCGPKLQERQRTGVSDWWPSQPVPEDIGGYFSRLATAARDVR